MTNLLQETLQELADNRKSANDVAFVRFGNDEGFYCSWEQFAEATQKFEFNSVYGGAEVDRNLKIVGDDWWLERGEYDGSEWWEFKTLPTKPGTHRVPVADDFKED